MNENFYNQRKMRSMQAPADLNKNGHTNNGAQIPQNFSHNSIHNRQHLNHTPSANHITQNMLPQLVNLISPQISVSQPGNQPMINMGFNAAPFLPNQLYSLPNTFSALNTIASQGYGTGNVNSYMNNIRMSNGPPVQSTVNYKDTKMVSMSKSKPVMSNNNKVTNYPVRLLVNSELVGPLIGRKGEKIKEITATTGAKIDIKRESVPYSQFGLNNYMFSGCNRKGSGSGDGGDHVVTANNHTNRGESQIVFIVGEPEKCTAAIQEIMHLCTQEAAEQGREEPNLGLLAEDRFCARIIGKEGRYLNFVRCKSNSQVHVSNVPTITTLSQQPHIISLDRIVSCRGGGLTSLLEAERLISEKVRQCVTEDGQNLVMGQKNRLSKDDSFLPPRATEMSLFNQYCAAAVAGVGASQPSQGPMAHLEDIFMGRRAPLIPTGSGGSSGGGTIGSGIVHKANPNWPDNLKLDENLYVRIAQMCAGSIIGSEGKSVKRIMADTGTYVQISKTNLSPVESVPAVHTYRKMAIPSDNGGGAGGESTVTGDLDQRLVTIKGSVPNQCSALAHIYNRVKVCYNQCCHNTDYSTTNLNSQDVRLWVMVRIPKVMLGRLIGKDGKVIRQLQLSSRTFLSFPRLRARVPLPISEESAGNDRDPNVPLEAATQPPIIEDAHKANNNDLLHNPDTAIFGDPDLHPVEIFGSYDAVECAVLMIRRLIYSCIFNQYGPALIAGPVSALPVPLATATGPLQPTFLVSPMLPSTWHPRRGTNNDFATTHYYNPGTAGFCPRTFGPGPMSTSIPTHVNNNKNYKRPQYCQRMKGERRLQSDLKPLMRNESDETNPESVADSDPVTAAECGCGSTTNNGNDSVGGDGSDSAVIVGDGATVLSPKRVLVKCRSESLPLSSPAPPSSVAASATLFDSSFVSAGDELGPRFCVGSPPGSSCYYSDCCSATTTPVNRSSAVTVDDLSFMTAQDRSMVGDCSCFPDGAAHCATAATAIQPSLASLTSSPPPPSSSLQSPLLAVANNTSFSHWSLSQKPTF